ncbi:PD-(D/E)XK nuclease family protein [Virgibacillus sediminis]|uniref:PD-(D/E)XK nuclease family protein n=1 Tax=Virgibacillus sediminis TaxID=202260 RepID=A0ABV7A419_9BACI
MIFSFSRLNLYSQCPYRFYNKYVLGKEEPVTKPLALGKAVHQAIDDIINGASHEEAVLNGYAATGFHEELMHQEISDLVERAPVHRNMGRTEVYFKLPLSKSHNAPEIQGYIDLLSPDGAITDWKTNRSIYGVQDNKQLALYAWATSQKTGIDRVKGILYFLRFRIEKGRIFSKEEMEKARKWALDTADEINERLNLLEIMPEERGKLFPPRPSRQCSHCPFASQCVKRL